MLGKGVDQPVQPAGLRNGVVVEQHHEIAAGQCDAVVAGRDEAAVARTQVIVQTGDLRQLFSGGVAAAVVHDDDFHTQQRRMRRQRAQAGQGVRNVVVDRNHHRHPRGRAVRQRERRERGGLRQPQRRAHGDRGRLRVHANALPGGAPAARAHAGHAAVDQAEDAIEQIARIGQRHRHCVGTPAWWGSETWRAERGSRQSLHLPAQCASHACAAAENTSRLAKRHRSLC